MIGGELEVTVENRDPKSRISSRRLAYWGRRILCAAGWKKAALSVVLVGDREMRKFHRRYLGKTNATDVLAFPPRPLPAGRQRRVPYLGDVIISAETARRAAPRFGNRWNEEVLLYLCHGLLHLMGCEDGSRREKAKMDRRQERILKKVLGNLWRSKRQKRLF